MRYRSISSHRGNPDPQVIELAARLGFNDVCFQTEGSQLVMLRELRERADRSGTFSLIKNLGMTVSLWTHEFEDLDPSWGAVALDNEVLWEGLRARYTHLLGAWFPEVDFLVLTVVESTVRVTDPALLEKLVLVLRDVCHAAGKHLIIRSFVWTIQEFEGVRATIERLPDDVSVMTKYVPQDWHRGRYDDGRPFHDPLIGKVGGKDQFVELDIAGEYFRGDQLGHCFAEELFRQFAFWQENGVDGLSVRIDRGWNAFHHHDCIRHEIQEANLWCLGAWAAGNATEIDSPLRAWAAESFAVPVESGTAGELAAIARCCDEVVREGLTVCGEPLGDTRRRQPALRSLLPPKESPATIHHPAKAENHGDPFCRWLALWRWDPSLRPRYEALRRGDPVMASRKKADTEAALAKADEALRRLDAIRGQIDPGAHAFLRFRLEENRHHLLLMAHAAQAWLTCLRLAYGGNPSEIHPLIEHHLDAMQAEWMAHRHESATVVWPAHRTRFLQRCTYLDVPEFCAEMRRYSGITKSNF